MSALHPGDDASLTPAMQQFFAYRLAVLADEVSQAMAQLYADRFSLTRNEWRVLAAVADMKRCTATEVAQYSTLDKMQVSRALAALEERGLVARGEGRADRRTKTLALTATGLSLYNRIVPLVQERQVQLLSALSETERAVMNSAIDRLLEQARQLQAV